MVLYNALYIFTSGADDWPGVVFNTRWSLHWCWPFYLLCRQDTIDFRLKLWACHKLNKPGFGKYFKNIDLFLLLQAYYMICIWKSVFLKVLFYASLVLILPIDIGWKTKFLKVDLTRTPRNFIKLVGTQLNCNSQLFVSFYTFAVHLYYLSIYCSRLFCRRTATLVIVINSKITVQKLIS